MTTAALKSLRDPRERGFVRYVIAELKKAGMKLVFRPTTDTGSGESFAGRFDPGVGITICTKQGYWVDTLVHEFSHFLQEKCGKMKIYEDNLFHAWIRHEVELSHRALQKHYKAELLIELDAEKRALRLLKRMKIPISRKTYVTVANTNLYFYGFARRNRVWCDHRGPSDVNKIREMMPRELLQLKDYKRPPIGFDALVAQNCIKKLSTSVKRKNIR